MCISRYLHLWGWQFDPHPCCARSFTNITQLFVLSSYRVSEPQHDNVREELQSVRSAAEPAFQLTKEEETVDTVGGHLM